MTQFLADEFGRRVLPFSTLSTPSTALVLNCLESSLDLARLSFSSVLVCDLPLQKMQSRN
jgi:hypothetical protein